MRAETGLIAPCGMNCGICLAYLRKERGCPGCHRNDAYKSISRAGCIIRNCEIIRTNSSGFCYDCSRYPCRRLKQLDKRYRTKYAMSMIDNLARISELGLDAFVKNEGERWRCPNCGGTICVHRGRCLSCSGRTGRTAR
jgi:hypothetical protein